MVTSSRLFTTSATLQPGSNYYLLRVCPAAPACLALSSSRLFNLAVGSSKASKGTPHYTPAEMLAILKALANQRQAQVAMAIGSSLDCVRPRSRACGGVTWRTIGTRSAFNVLCGADRRRIVKQTRARRRFRSLSLCAICCAISKSHKRLWRQSNTSS